MLFVKLTRTSIEDGGVYASGNVAGPFIDQEQAESAAADLRSQDSNPDSAYEVKDLGFVVQALDPKSSQVQIIEWHESLLDAQIHSAKTQRVNPLLEVNAIKFVSAIEAPGIDEIRYTSRVIENAG